MKIMTPQRNIPTILVIFGATGDLTEKKIIPALFNLWQHNNLPNRFQVVGFSRRELSNDAFRNFVAKRTKGGVRVSNKPLSSFLQLFSYQQGFLEKRQSYKNLAKVLKNIDDKWGVCTNKIFYLAVVPQFYQTVFKHLAASGLSKPCSPEEGWTRILVEKPFGKDLETAEKLELLLSKLFKEIQIYRIDHYLAKEMVQNILSFRFANNLFEQNWSNKNIERIDIRLLETIGVEKRGIFYDGLGALRDVGQNHLLQMLALVTMEHPQNFTAEAIREKRAEILETLEPLSKEEILTSTFRAQYSGYRRIRNVRKNSDTETYFKAKIFFSSPRWQGVPFFLESGKRLSRPKKEIVITFRHPIPCLCPKGTKEHYRNTITISLEPYEGIVIRFWSKKPGLNYKLEERTFDFLFRGRRTRVQYVEEYAKLLLDSIVGDQTLFVSTAEVRAMWRLVDPVSLAWEKNLVPLRTYKPNTNQILNKTAIIETHLPSRPIIKKKIGVIGLGKMGKGIAQSLMEKGWRVVGFNRTTEVTQNLEKEGLIPSYSFKELVKKLPRPRIVWLMLPAGVVVDEAIFSKEGLVKVLERGDIIIDGGNSFYQDAIRRGKKLKKFGITFIDVGVSGGPRGAREGASLMIGGEEKNYLKLEPLFRDLAQADGYQFFEGVGAGHFVKMVHNGIEYGMMQALAEGFTILKKATYHLDLKRAAHIYNHGSVIESRLVGWLRNAFELHGKDLRGVTGRVGHTGEGEWTVKTAKAMGLKAKIIEGALKFRKTSKKNPSYTGKVLSALREQFGRHSVK